MRERNRKRTNKLKSVDQNERAGQAAQPATAGLNKEIQTALRASASKHLSGTASASVQMKWNVHTADMAEAKGCTRVEQEQIHHIC